MNTFGKNAVGFAGSAMAFAAMLWCMDSEPTSIGRTAGMLLFGSVIAAFSVALVIAAEKTAANFFWFCSANAGVLVGLITLMTGLANPQNLIHGSLSGLLYMAGFGVFAGSIGSLAARLVSLALDLKTGRTTWKRLLSKASRFVGRVVERLPSRENLVAFFAGVASFVLLILAVDVIGGRESEAYSHDIIFALISGTIVVGSALGLIKLAEKTPADWRVFAGFTAAVPALAFSCEFLFLGASIPNILFVAVLIAVCCALPGLAGSLAARLSAVKQADSVHA